jgi:alkaline phosphatase D
MEFFMFKPFMVSLLLLSQIAYSQSNFERLHSLKTIERLAFGSCSNQFHSQPLWKDLISVVPDLFIWGGDNIYAETTNPDVIKASYRQQNQNIDYAFLKSLTPIIGTWDDHDVGYDNARGNFPFKKESQTHLLDFLEEPDLSKRRMREGIYTSYEFGQVPQKIKIILLDNRYFKDLDPSAPMLGQEQWKWLEEEFKNSDASLHFVVSGLSILSPKLIKTDEWADYPKEHSRLLKLVKEHQPKGLVFLAGDKHFSSIFKNHGHLEFMSSGMTHTARRSVRGYINRKYPNTYFGLNYGLIDIEWDNSVPLLNMSIRTPSGSSINQRKFRWDNEKWLKI